MKHRLVEKDETARTGVCAVCGPTRLKAAGRGRRGGRLWKCATAHGERQPPRPVGRNRAGQLRRFGLTVAEYDELLTKQGGVCAICAEGCPTGRRLAVDHDHESGAVRGLLCTRCNIALGNFRDRPDLLVEAMAYLHKHEGHGSSSDPVACAHPPSCGCVLAAAAPTR